MFPIDHVNNPYRSPTADCAVTPAEHVGTLIDRALLYRKVKLPSPIDATIEYYGRGLGYESILIDGRLAIRKTSWLWFVPHFDFVVATKSGDLAGSIDVRVAPWLMISRFQITIEGKVVYAES
jgi:hypothetical protein